VVIETASFDLKIVSEAAWEMSEAEEEQQRQANGIAMTDFMDRLAEATGTQDLEMVDDTPAEWNEKPQTEEEAEQQQARGELLADRIQARLGREGKDADYEKILEEEMQRGRGELETTPEELARKAEWIEKMNRAGEEALADPGPEIEAELKYRHPLVEKVMELSLQMRATAEAEVWLPEDALPEHPVAELLNATMIAGPKMAGALNGRYWPPEIEFCAYAIVRLKRARGYIDDALRAAESCQEEKLIQPAHLEPIVVELIDLGQNIDELITELRAKLGRGTD
jgi:hypothetical protein